MHTLGTLLLQFTINVIIEITIYFISFSEYELIKNLSINTIFNLI